MKIRKETIKNKLAALALLLCGIFTLPICDGDVTVFVGLSALSVAMFLAKKDIFE